MSEVMHEYLHIMKDPAHGLVEFTFVAFDVFVINKFRDWRHGHKHKENK